MADGFILVSYTWVDSVASAGVVLLDGNRLAAVEEVVPAMGIRSHSEGRFGLRGGVGEVLAGGLRAEESSLSVCLRRLGDGELGLLVEVLRGAVGLLLLSVERALGLGKLRVILHILERLGALGLGILKYLVECGASGLLAGYANTGIILSLVLRGSQKAGQVTYSIALVVHLLA